MAGEVVSYAADDEKLKIYLNDVVVVVVVGVGSE